MLMFTFIPDMSGPHLGPPSLINGTTMVHRALELCSTPPFLCCPLLLHRQGSAYGMNPSFSEFLPKTISLEEILNPSTSIVTSKSLSCLSSLKRPTCVSKYLTSLFQTPFESIPPHLNHSLSPTTIPLVVTSSDFSFVTHLSSCCLFFSLKVLEFNFTNSFHEYVDITMCERQGNAAGK